ncbi:MAG: riboflavin biosynthesis protein RibF [Paludibacteraceae bacterium]|nr:riboflavin biosynthesis protein RibF [Paludibacteraceae bacterium]
MPRIATIGFFDGVHRGHRFLFAQLLELAHERHLEPLIFTFDRHPKEVLTGVCPPMLTTYGERQRLLAHHAQVRVLPFADVQGLTAEQFMRYLKEQEQVEVLLMGYDHCFGSDQLKGFSEYEKVARRVGLHVERAHECLVDSLPVSSTRIRKLLREGQVKQVNRLLGYDYSLSGIVEHGNGIGAQLGFPTANICIQSDKLLPMSGVYMAKAQVVNDGETDAILYAAVVNIGNNPTVGNDYVTVEAHLIDYQGDLYEKTLMIAFCDFLRKEKKFASLADLREQIAEDVQSLSLID